MFVVARAVVVIAAVVVAGVVPYSALYVVMFAVEAVRAVAVAVEIVVDKAGDIPFSTSVIYRLFGASVSPVWSVGQHGPVGGIEPQLADGSFALPPGAGWVPRVPG